MTTPLAALTVAQLDVVLAGNVRERVALQEAVVLALDNIDRKTRRIEVLLEQRAQASALYRL